MKRVPMIPLPTQRSVIRKATSVLVFRKRDVCASKENYEILFIRRSRKSGFFADNYVFPGGVLESKHDSADIWSALTDKQHKNKYLCPIQTETTGERLYHRICGLRELFEETGLLLVHNASGMSHPHMFTPNEHKNMRKQVHNDAKYFGEMFQSINMLPSAFSMIPYQRWITPNAEKKRYDTWFYLTMLPDEERDVHVEADDTETTHCVWLSPSEALLSAAEGEINLPPPTTYILSELSSRHDLMSLMNEAQKSASLRVFLPTIYAQATSPENNNYSKQMMVTLPGDPLHDMEAQQEEIRQLDGEGVVQPDIDIHKGVHRILTRGSDDKIKGWEVVRAHTNSKL